MKTQMYAWFLRDFCFTCTHTLVINSGCLGLVLTAMLLGDKGNPAIIFSEQATVIFPLTGGKPQSSTKGFFQCSAA